MLLVKKFNVTINLCQSGSKYEKIMLFTVEYILSKTYGI
jgi:hypothetical protein